MKIKKEKRKSIKGRKIFLTVNISELKAVLELKFFSFMIDSKLKIKFSFLFEILGEQTASILSIINFNSILLKKNKI